MRWLDYIRTSDFWKQLAYMIVIGIFLIVIILFSLQFCTRHGQEVKVPDLKGYTLDQLKELEKDYKFKFVVRDSVFEAKAVPGTIISQTPTPGSIVKTKRTFYVVLAAMNASSIRMPNLIDLSYRQAVSLLETYGLKAGAVNYVSSMAKNAVIRQLYQQKEISPGSSIKKGSVIDLEIGSGEAAPAIDSSFGESVGEDVLQEME
ncbi:MAG: PASTA domain-containing protein [Bacteroidales bacterium]